MDENPYKSPRTPSERRRVPLTPFQIRALKIVVTILVLAGILAFLFVPQVNVHPPHRGLWKTGCQKA